MKKEQKYRKIVIEQVPHDVELYYFSRGRFYNRNRKIPSEIPFFSSTFKKQYLILQRERIAFTDENYQLVSTNEKDCLVKEIIKKSKGTIQASELFNGAK